MAGSILVNGILYFSAIWIWHLQNTKTWNHLGIIYHMLIDDRDYGYLGVLFEWPRVHRNPRETFHKPLARSPAHGIMYHHVIHDSKRSAQVWVQNRVDMAVSVYCRKTFETWFAGKRKKMSLAPPAQKLLRIVFRTYMCFPGSEIHVFLRGPVCVRGWRNRDLRGNGKK